MSKEEKKDNIELPKVKEKSVDVKEKEVTKGKKTTKEVKDNKIGIYGIVKIVFFAVIFVMSIIMGYSLIRTNMIPNKYIMLLVIVLLVLNIIMGLVMKSKKKWLNVIGFVLIVLLSFVMGVGTKYVNKTMNILEGFVTQNEERTTYYVLTRKGVYTDVSELEGKVAGLLSQEADLLKEEVSKKVQLEYKEYSSMGDLIYGLDLNEIDVIIISSTVYEYIIEENGSIEEMLEKIDEVEVVGKPTTITSNIDVGNSFLIYISGLDTRDTTHVASYGLSDVNIVVAVNPDTHRVLLVHIPRDYYVYVYGRPQMKDKLTHAGLYGIDASMNTVASIFDINLDTYVKVNFKALTTVVDAIDGIDVYSDTAFQSSHMKTWYVNKGMNHMDGAKALAYSRERYAYATGDRHRGQNQNDVIQAIIKKVSQNPDYLLKYDKILGDMQPYFTTNFEMSSIQQLVKEQVDSMASWKVESISVNGSNSSNYTASWPNQYTYVMIPNQSTIDTAKAKIAEVMRG